MPTSASRSLLLLLATLVLSGPVCLALAQSKTAQTKGPKVVRRAQPPKFDKADIFYADAFREGLVGERPANLGQSAAVASTGSPVPGGLTTDLPMGVAGAGWSALISAATIEDEVKSLKLQVDQHVTTPSDFAGKGYKLARRDFSMLALLFGIAGEYETDVRWKKDAPAARDVLARTAANAKVGTSQVFQEAKLRRDELTDLVSGSNPFGGKVADAKATWKDVCSRTPLMQHLETIWEPRLKPLLADKGQFNANGPKVLHDAEIVAAIGEVLAKDGMADADAEEYKAICAKLRDGAKAIIDGVKLKNFDAASAGGATISKACAECHEAYRS